MGEGFWVGACLLLFAIMLFAYGTLDKKLDDCRKEHNVYRCELVAVPVPAEKLND